MIKLIRRVACVAFSAIGGSLFAYNGGYENSLTNDTTIGGETYKGYGNSTLTARRKTGYEFDAGTTIKRGAYAQCAALKAVDLAGVEVIEDAAFAYSALTSVELPSTLTSMGFIAFGGCRNLASVRVNGWGWHDAAKDHFRETPALKTIEVVGAAATSVPGFDLMAVFADLTTIKCPNANVSMWKAAYPALSVVGVSADDCFVRLHSNFGTDAVVEQTFKSGVAQSISWISTLGWTRSGYVFAGWGAKPDTLTASYINGQKATFTDPSKVTDLYAIWKATSSTYTITLHRNTGASDASATGQIVSQGEMVSLCWIGQIGWTREGHVFAGWGTKADATAVSYINGQKVTDLAVPGKVKHLYAVWKPRDTAYTITLHRNMSSADTSATGQIVSQGESVSLAWISQIGWTREGYVFAGWGTKASATAISYINGQKVVDLAEPGKVKHLYAIWKLRSTSYTVTFNKNDGTGAKTGKIFTVGESAALVWITQIGWTLDGYKFVGWSKTPGSSVVAYGNGEKVTDLAAAGGTCNLYAVWQKRASAVSVPVTKSPTTFAEGEQDVAGYYRGVLSDDAGFYEMIVDKDGSSGFVRIEYEDGEIMTAEAEITETDSGFIVMTADGETYLLAR